MKHRGLAQIPLMIGLLLMAVALPVATKLVQDNQDNRNKAMEVGDCVRDVDCGSGYHCKSGLCVKNAPTSKPASPTSGYCNVALIDTSECGGGDCDPDEVEQTWRTASCGTNKVCKAVDSCKASVCSTGQYKCVGTKSVACLNGQFNGATQECGTLGCNASTNKCNVAPTATAVPTSPSVYGKQGDLCTSTVTSGMRLPNCSTYCLNGKFYYVLAEGTYRCGVSPTSVPPTVKPTPINSCLKSDTKQCINGETENCTCGSQGCFWMKTGYECEVPCCCNAGNLGQCYWGSGPGRCGTILGTKQADSYCSGKVKPTSIPTGIVRPTAIPTINCLSDNTPCNVGLGPRCTKCCNGSHGYFNDGDIQNLVYKCGPDPAKITPTAVPTVSTSCSAKNLYVCGTEGGCPSGYRCMLSGSYYCKNDSTCSGISPTTTKPTVKPTVKPTSIPCASTGQACSTRSCCTTADVCTDEGLSYPKCVPRNQIPTYIPVPTIKCAKSGSSCTTMPCCEAYLDVCTDEGLSYPKCVPRNQIPTYIPVPTMLPCAKIGESCSSTLGCCGMSDKCTNGKCVATAGPSVPPSECGGKTPPDQCPMSGNPNQLGVNAQCITLNGKKVWDWDLKNCDQKGRTSACGIKNYCCPSVGGNWTTDMTQCPVTCTQCAGKPEAKGKGDADCSGVTDINDASIWRSEFTSGQLGTEVSSTWRADFDCDGKVTLNDISIWRENFIKGLTN